MRLLRLQGVTASLRIQMETRSEELREKEEESSKVWHVELRDRACNQHASPNRLETSE